MWQVTSGPCNVAIHQIYLTALLLLPLQQVDPGTWDPCLSLYYAVQYVMDRIQGPIIAL